MPPKKRAPSGKKVSANIPRNLEDLEKVLRAFLGGDSMNPPADINAAISAATTTLRSFVKMPESVLALMSRIAMVDSPADTRQLACVLMTKNIKTFWARLHKSNKLSPQMSDADSCRSKIMEILHSGTAPPGLIHSLSYLTAVIARMDFAKGRFLQLIDWMNGALESTNPLHVEAALRILSNILNSVVAGTLEPHFPLYAKACLFLITNPPNSIIRCRALMALDPLLNNFFNEEVDPGTNAVVPSLALTPAVIIPALITSLQQAIASRDYHSLPVIAEMCSHFAGADGLEPLLIPLLEAFRLMVHSSDFDFHIRDTFAYFFADVVEFYSKLITTPHQRPDGTVSTLLDVFISVITDLFIEYNEDPFDHEEPNHPHLIGLRILEKLFSHVQLEPVYSRVGPLALRLLQSNDEQVRKGGLILVMSISEYDTLHYVFSRDLSFGGENLSLDEIFNKFFTQVITNTSTESKLMFDSACVAMTNVIMNTADHYNETNGFKAPLELILTTLQTAPTQRRYRLLSTMSELIDVAKDKIVPYLQPIMAQMAHQLQINDPDQQEVALRCITNVALSVEGQFLPYFGQLFPLLEQIICAETTPVNEPVQCAAYVCLASSARMVEVTNWSPEIQQKLFHLVDNCIIEIGRPEQNNHNLVQQFCVYISNIAISLIQLSELNDLILDKITQVYDCLIDVLVSFSGCHFYSDDKDATALKGFDQIGPVDGEDDDDDDDEDDEMGENDQYYFDDGALASKISAIDSLELIVRELGPRIYNLKLKQKHSAALSLAPEVFELAGGNYTPGEFSLDPVVRVQEAIFQQIALFQNQCCTEQYSMLGTLVLSVLGPVLGPNFPHSPGVTYPLPEAFTNVSEPILTIMLAALNDENEEIVAEALFQIVHMLNAFGISILSNEEISRSLYDAVRDLTFERAECFVVDDEYKDQGARQGEFALENVAGMIGELASKLGPVFFVKVWTPELGERMLKLCGPERTETMRAIWIGSFADIFAQCKESAQHLIPTILPLTQVLLETGDASIRRNTLYCISEALSVINRLPDLKAQFQSSPLIPTLFSLITPHFLTPEKYHTNYFDSKGAHDNVVSAALRFITVYPEAFPPTLIPQILVVFPLNGDVDEIATMLTQTLPALFTSATDAMRSFVGQTLAQIAMAIRGKYWGSRLELEQPIIQFGKQLLAAFPQEAQTAPQHLQPYPDAMEALQSLVQ